MRFDEIVEEVNTLLSTKEGVEKVRERRAAASKMARGLRRWAEIRGPRLSRRGATFTASQGALHGVKNEIVISVEINGRGVGTLHVPSNDDSPLFTPKGSKAQLRWSGDREHATAIRRLFEEYRGRTRVPERAVQGKLSGRSP